MPSARFRLIRKARCAIANELTLNWDISVNKQPPMSAPVGMNIFRQLNNVSSGDYQRGIVLASHTGRTIVPLGKVGTNSLYFCFANPSGTETVGIFADGATGAQIGEMRPSTSGVIPVHAGITPYVLAGGSVDVEIEYLMLGR